MIRYYFTKRIEVRFRDRDPLGHVNDAVYLTYLKRDPAALQRMLVLTQGVRQVPVIVEGGRVTIGFGGT